MPPEATPDGRPGVRVLFCAGSVETLQYQLHQPRRPVRADQSRLGLLRRDRGRAGGRETLKLGDGLRYFADGWQISKRLGTRRYWRLPVMDGEFVCEGLTGLTRAAVGGGNLILLARSSAGALAAAEAAADAIAAVPDAIAPFPGGIVRSGSKVGSKYKALFASTNDAFCPTLRGVAKHSELDADTVAVLELVIDGLTADAVAAAMRAGLHAVLALGPERGAARVSAGNYGGNLGRHHFHLRDLLA